jgi:hypothetical protein
MSRRKLRALLAGTLAALGTGFAGAGSLEAMLSGALQTSAAPSLLGPISESGRKGWACKPERAASAHAPKDAELPVPEQTP